jgi:hypothetical protein
VSVPRPARSAYLRRLQEERLRAQVNMARAALRRNRGRLVAIAVGVSLLLAAAGGALAIVMDRVFR